MEIEVDEALFYVDLGSGLYSCTMIRANLNDFCSRHSAALSWGNVRDKALKFGLCDRFGVIELKWRAEGESRKFLGLKKKDGLSGKTLERWVLLNLGRAECC